MQNVAIFVAFYRSFLNLKSGHPQNLKIEGGGSTLGHVYDRTYTIYSGVGRSFAL